MDSLTQLTLGAAVAEAVLGKKIGNKAILWGALAGTIPDLDIIPGLFMDEVSSLAFHRGISHSIFFLALLAPLLALLTTNLYKKQEATFKQWTWMFFLALVTHPLLDNFTNYGTQIFQPFSDYRVSWNSIFIVDPLYTVPLLISVIALMFYNRNSNTRKVISRAGIAISCLYLVWGLGAKLIAQNSFHTALTEQNIEYKRLLTTPTPLNSVLWYAVAETETGYYYGLYSLLEDSEDITFDFENPDKHLLAGLEQTTAIQTLLWFSNGYYRITEKDGQLVFNDLRFGKADGLKSESDTYVFTFELKNNEQGELTFDTVIHGADEMDDLSNELGKLWDRIWVK